MTSRRRATLALLGVIALSFALYAPSLGNRFAYDDRAVAMAVRDSGEVNEMVHDLQPLPRYFTTNYWHGMSDRDILYRPVTILSYALLHAAIGRHLDGEAGEALPQHAANVLLHLLAVWLTYAMVRRLRVPRPGALVAALLFGVHAIHSEVVAGVVGRAELLSFDFGAAALLLYDRGTRRRAGRALALAGSACALFLALCSKESGVVWVAFLPTFGLARALCADRSAAVAGVLAAQVGRALLVGAGPLLAFLLLRAGVIAGLPEQAVAGWTALQEAKKAAGIGWAYGAVQWGYALLITVLPFHLAADHGPRVFDAVRSLADPRLLGASAALLGLLALGLLALRRHPLLFLAMATFLGFSFLTSNVPFRIGTDYAERLYYAPSLAVGFAGAWCATRPGRRARPALALALAAWVAWSGAMILARNGVWRDDHALFSHEIENQPDSVVVRYNWAGILADQGRIEEATGHLERAIALCPEVAQAKHHNLLGVFHARAGRYDEAARAFVRATEYEHAPPRFRAEVWLNLAGAHCQAGRPGAGRQAVARAVELDAAGVADRVAQLGARHEAALGTAWLADLLRDGEARAPGAPAWALHRGELAYRHGQTGEARGHLERFLVARPAGRDAPRARLLLASVLASEGQTEAALALARQVAGDAGAPAPLRAEAGRLVQRIRNAPK